VLSVKLHFRVPPAEVRRVALDEGSRTSAALTQILLAELCNVHPEWETLSIGSDQDATDADAVLLIGDRAIINAEPSIRLRAPNGEPRTAHRVLSTEYAVTRTEQKVLGSQGVGPEHRNAAVQCNVWDLGERWYRWTGLPFVFAMWIARPGVHVAEVSAILAAARDAGVRHLAEIASRESVAMQVPVDLAKGYLCDNLHFVLGSREGQGLRRFYRLCTVHGLAPRGLEPVLEEITSHDCPTI
jgi:chorismate dehydratase